jgi:hypothetical protein
MTIGFLSVFLVYPCSIRFLIKTGVGLSGVALITKIKANVLSLKNVLPVNMGVLFTPNLIVVYDYLLLHLAAPRLGRLFMPAKLLCNVPLRESLLAIRLRMPDTAVKKIGLGKQLLPL